MKGGALKMLQAFIIVLREGFESFLIVAIILSYLQATDRGRLLPAVYTAIAVAVLVSAGLGYLLGQGVNQALWEGVLGLVAIVMVGTLVIHMWKFGPRMRRRIQKSVDKASARKTGWAAFIGVFLFTVLMIAREGMETALMLYQVREGEIVWGSLLGTAGAVGVSWLWIRFSHLINVRKFFQVTGVFLLLFIVQIAIYTFHEFTEAGIFPNSEALHVATEPYSPDGTYGRWFSLLMVAGCVLWLTAAWARSRRLQWGRPPALPQAPSDRFAQAKPDASL